MLLTIRLAYSSVIDDFAFQILSGEIFKNLFFACKKTVEISLLVLLIISVCTNFLLLIISALICCLRSTTFLEQKLNLSERPKRYFKSLYWSQTNAICSAVKSPDNEGFKTSMRLTNVYP